MIQVNHKYLNHNKRNLGHSKRNLSLSLNELRIQLHLQELNLKSQHSKSLKIMHHYLKLRLNQNLFRGQRKIENKLNIPQLVDMLTTT